MLRHSPPARFPALRLGRLALLLAALAASSCSPKEIVLDPGTGLEGTPSASYLVVYPDVPLTTYTFDDVGRPTCSDDDTLASRVEVYRAGAGTVFGTIFDFTAASAFQTFRAEGSSFRPLKDFLLQPVKRWPYGQTDAFEFRDPTPRPAPFQSYVGRGVVEGGISPLSPLTNVGTVSVQPTATIRYLGRTNLCGDFPPPGEATPDSLLPMAWSDVPGAAGYWVHVYQFGTGANFLDSRFPSPAYLGRTVDYFLAYFPAPVTSYKIGDPVPPGARIVVRRTLFNSTDYAVRVTAVNAAGQLIAYPSQQGGAFLVLRDQDVETRYYVQTLGAFVVHTGQPAACPPGCPQPAGSALPNVKIFFPSARPAELD